MLRRGSVAVLLLIVFCAPVRAAEAGLKITGGLVREFIVEPGETAVEHLEMTNTRSEKCAVHLYLKDYISVEEGASFEPSGDHDRSNAGWMVNMPQVVNLAGGEGRRVNLRIEVPDDDLRGTYWSVLMVEPRGGQPEEAPEVPDPGLRVRTRYRQAILIITHAGDRGQRGIEPLGAELRVGRRGEGGGGSAHNLRLDLVNTGESGLNPDLWVEIYDRRGGKVFSTRYERDNLRLLPGMHGTVEFELENLEHGKEYEALLVISEDREHTWAVQYLLKTGGRNGPDGAGEP